MRTTHGGPSGKHKTPRPPRPPKPWNPKFLSIDGEGFTDAKGIHRYMLLACSDGSFISDNLEGLSTTDCFRYLMGIASEHRNVHLVCYGASYDVNMMLRDVPRENLIELWQTSRCTFWPYTIEYMPRKKLTVTLWNGRTKAGHFILYDVIGFFQKKFTKTIEEWLGKDYHDLQVIAQNKDLRSQFTSENFDTILAYCRMELKALDLIMIEFKNALDGANIHPSSWIGAGALATALLKKNHIKQYMEPTHITNPQIYQAARYAFFGGRIELLKYGTYEGPLYHYDINSAYPSAIAQLPKLKDAAWLHYNVPPFSDFSIVHIRWDKLKGSFTPFPVRNKQGFIYFPDCGEGWYWGSEVNAAIKNNISFHYLEHWELEHAEPAFPWVEPLYEHRKQLKADCNPAHYPIKLGLNSLYGKQIQRVGGDIRRQLIPSYHQLEWAGYTTARTRAKLYNAAMQNPDAIVSFQTDGIISTKPLDLDIGPNLGQWTQEETADKGVFVQSGVYFLHFKHGWEGYYRGFDEGTITPDAIVKAWADGLDAFPANCTRFITLGTACNSDNGWSKWRTWPTVKRYLSLYPTGKREDKEDNFNPSTVLCGTNASTMYLGYGNASEPYDLPWDSWFGDKIDGVDERVFLDEWEDGL